MKEINYLSAMLTSYSVIPNFNADLCVDWAIEMLEAGYDTPSLLILSSLSKPTNYFETIEILKSAFEELDLEFKTGEEALICFCSYFVNQIAKRQEVRVNLDKIYDIYNACNQPNSIYDFYLLSWAWSDLCSGYDAQDYWPNVSLDTIEEKVVEYCKNWLE